MHLSPRLLLVVCLFFASAVPLPGQTASPPLVIRDISVVDVREGALRPHQTVLVRGDRIAAVGPSGDVAFPAGAVVIDGSGHFLIPGLWDMHVHTGNDRNVREVVYPLHVAHGVTGIRNMGADCFDCQDSIERVHARRRAITAGELIGPRVVASSDYAGSHEQAARRSTEGSSPQAPATEGDARAFVRLVKERGVDFIKVYDMLPREAYFALAEEAIRLGLQFAGHVPAEVRASEASYAGQASIEHMRWVGILNECSSREDELRKRLVAVLEEADMGSRHNSDGPAILPLMLEMVDTHDQGKCATLAERFGRNGTWVVPNLMTARLPSEPRSGWREDPYARFLTPGERRYFEWAEEVYAHDLGDAEEQAPVSRWAREVTQAIHRAGVPILAGSDAGAWGIFWGIGLHQELELLVDAGLTDAEALRAATFGPAEFLEATDSLGTVEPGKVADLVLLEANPLEDISNTQRIAAVMSNGRYFDRDAVDAMLVDAERAARLLGRPVEPDTVRYVALAEGEAVGEWLTWQEAPDTWGFRTDRLYYFPRTERLVLDDEGLPVRLDVEGEYGDGLRWYEIYAREDGAARWYTPRERGATEVSGPVYYAAVHPGHDLGVLARALLHQESATLPLLPAGVARLEALGARTIEAGGNSRTVRLYAIHGTDLFPRYVWLDQDGSTFAEEWSIRAGWEAAFPELRAATDAAVADYRKALARDLVPPARTRPLAIRGARLFDAATGQVHDGTTILVEGGRIAAVGADDSVSLPAGAEMIEGDGRMVLPGLWDMHAHLTFPGGEDPIWGRGFAPLHVAAGVTTARDLGSHIPSLVALREAVDAGRAVGPRILAAGYMDGTESAARWAGVRVGTTEEVQAAVDRFAELGFVQIKIYNEVPADLVHVAVERAKEHDLRVSGHVPYAMTAREAVEAGFDEIQHVQMTFAAMLRGSDDEELFAPGESWERWETWYQVSSELTPDSETARDFIALLRDREVAIDPTMGHFISDSAPPGFIADAVDRLPEPVRRRLKHSSFSGYYVPTNPLSRPAWQQTVDNMFGFILAAHRARVPILVGTDTWAGFGLHHEMELYVDAGIPASEVLTLTTLGAARVMNMDDELGSIEPRKLADLILVDGDPTEDIRDIRRVVTVIKDGRVYDPAAIYRALGIEPCCDGEPAEARR